MTRKATACKAGRYGFTNDQDIQAPVESGFRNPLVVSVRCMQKTQSHDQSRWVSCMAVIKLHWYLQYISLCRKVTTQCSYKGFSVCHVLENRCMQCSTSFFVDLFSQGIWKLIKDMEDPHLRSLAQKLPNTILHNRAEGTVKKYLGAFKR